MSVVAIRAALESALAAMSGGIAVANTAYENAPFTPVAGTPYQAVALLLARPDNAEISSAHVELGFMQVTLRYPLTTGTALIAAQAEAIRTAFRRGLSLTSGGIVTTITDTPEILPAFVDGDRFAMPVRIRFRAEVP